MTEVSEKTVVRDLSRRFGGRFRTPERRRHG